jgi:hypothetical protein
MVYLLVMLLATVATVASLRQAPEAATRIGAVAVALEVVAVAIAELTGNALLFYLGAFFGPYGVLVLLLGVVGVCRDRRGAGLPPG